MNELQNLINNIIDNSLDNTIKVLNEIEKVTIELSDDKKTD